MKKLSLVLGVIVIVLVVAVVVYWYGTANAEVGVLNIYTGSAEVMRKQGTVVGMTGGVVQLNDTIIVGQGSRVSIVLKDGSTVRLDAGTRITIDRSVLRIESGRAWSHVVPQQASTTFEIETPTIVATVRGTGFDTNYRDKISVVYVDTGTVEVALQSSRDDAQLVREGEVFTIHDGSAPVDFQQGPVAASSTSIREDEWVQFNQKEDAAREGGEVLEQGEVLISPTTTIQKPATPVQKAPALPPPQPSELLLAPTKKIVSLKLSVLNDTVKISESILLKVEARYDDNSVTPLGGDSDVVFIQKPEVGSIRGMFFTGGINGTAVITATTQGVVSNEIFVHVRSGQEVSAPQLIGVRVVCEKIDPPYNSQSQLPTADCIAIAEYSDEHTENITTRASWSVSGTAKGRIDSTGHYTPSIQGTDIVVGVFGGLQGSMTIQIP